MPRSDSHTLAPDHAPAGVQSARAVRVELQRGDDVWSFSCAAGDEALLVRALGELAMEPESGLDHFDLAVVAYRLGRLNRPDTPLSALGATSGP